VKRLLLSKEVAELLRISISQLCRLTKAGKIPAKDVGIGRNHAWRYDEDVLGKWIAEPAQRPAAPRRRIRTSTPVQRDNRASQKTLENKSENGRGDRIAYPVNGPEQSA
jgi:predicted site-specific integrase-resolvase